MPPKFLECGFFRARVCRGMLILLIFSSFLGLISTQWAMVWISFEVNTLIICFILIGELYTQKENNSAPFAYYAIQVFTSLLILWCMCKETSVNTIVVCMGALLFKVGAWPFHQWYLKLIGMLELFFYRIFLLMT